MQSLSVLQRNAGIVKVFDINRNCKMSLFMTLLVSLIISTVCNSPLLVNMFCKSGHNLCYIACCVALTFVCNLIFAQAVVSSAYGTKNRILCVILLQIIRNKKIASLSLKIVTAISSKIGKHNSPPNRESVAELCYVAKTCLVKMGMIGDEGRGRWARGAVPLLNAVVANPCFWGEGNLPDSDDTYKRLGRKLADEGENLFRTKEDVFFETYGKPIVKK